MLRFNANGDKVLLYVVLLGKWPEQFIGPAPVCLIVQNHMFICIVELHVLTFMSRRAKLYYVLLNVGVQLY